MIDSLETFRASLVEENRNISACEVDKAITALKAAQGMQAVLEGCREGSLNGQATIWIEPIQAGQLQNFLAAWKEATE